jgi:hypothetical protein
MKSTFKSLPFSVCSAHGLLLPGAYGILQKQSQTPQGVCAKANLFAQQTPCESIYTASSKPPAAIKSYRVVRLAEDGDVFKSYDLIIRFLKNPQSARRVEELILVTHHKYQPCNRKPFREEIIKWRVERGVTAPEEALLIRSFVGTLGLEDLRLNGIPMSDSLEDVLILDNIVARLNHDYRSSYEQRIEYLQAAAIALLALCPNIHTFRFKYLPETQTENYTYNSVLDTFLIRNNHEELPRLYLQNLRHINYIHNLEDAGTEGFVNLNGGFTDAIRFFHRLPKIETLSAAGIATDDGNCLLPGTSNVKRLQLDHVEMTSSTLASLIRASKRLEEVRISTGAKLNADGGFIHIIPKTLGKALLCHKSTLQQLSLDLDKCVCVTRPEEEDIWPEKSDEEWTFDPTHRYVKFDESIAASPRRTHEIPDDRKYGVTVGSLHDFTALTRLSVGIKMLLGWEVEPWGVESCSPKPSYPSPFRLVDALPPDLEELTLKGYRKGHWGWYDENVTELLKKKSELFPKLRQISGIDEEIPSARFVEEEEERYDFIQYWEARQERLDWVEATD